MGCGVGGLVAVPLLAVGGTSAVLGAILAITLITGATFRSAPEHQDRGR